MSVKWFRAGGGGGSGGRRRASLSSGASADQVVGAGGEFEELVGVSGGFYQPSVDDLQCRILVEVASKVEGDDKSKICDHGCVVLCALQDIILSHSVAQSEIWTATNLV